MKPSEQTGIPPIPARKSSYTHDELIDCARGKLFGEGNAQLPLPPMLMFDRITLITEDGGEYGKGQKRAVGCGPTFEVIGEFSYIQSRASTCKAVFGLRQRLYKDVLSKFVCQNARLN